MEKNKVRCEICKRKESDMDYIRVSFSDEKKEYVICVNCYDEVTTKALKQKLKKIKER